MIAYQSATEILGMLERRELSPSELFDEIASRVKRYNPALNAIVWQDTEGARKAASEITEPPDAAAPLRGIPMTVKEAYDLAGSPSTWGVPLLKNNIPERDSVVVERLRDAGAVVFGKTNVPFALSDLQSYNEIHGTTHNPWDPTRTPGGSSGGSAAALASGMTVLEMGSDIAGSIRNPAHYCGVFGHKPTWGLVPGRGHSLPGVLLPPDLAVVGPLARSAHDLALQLDVLGHPDELERGLRYDLPELGDRGLGDLRVAVWAEDDATPTSAAVQKRVLQVADALRDAGARVDEGARPAFTGAQSDEIFGYLLGAQLSPGMPPDVYRQLKQAAASGSDLPRFLAAQVLDHRAWLGYANRRSYLRWAWHEFFGSWDVVLMPVAPTSAFPHDHGPQEDRKIEIDGQPHDYFTQVFWAGIATVSQLPATVIPTGPDDRGLPIGVQIVGPEWGDRVTIGVARLLEEAGFRFQPPPLEEESA